MRPTSVLVVVALAAIVGAEQQSTSGVGGPCLLDCIPKGMSKEKAKCCNGKEGEMHWAFGSRVGYRDCKKKPPRACAVNFHGHTSFSKASCIMRTTLASTFLPFPINLCCFQMLQLLFCVCAPFLLVAQQVAEPEVICKVDQNSCTF
jgi:hypothetical protein